MLAQREGQTLMCPKCDTALSIALEEGVEVDACPKCQGVWVDDVEEKQVLQMKPDVFSVDELRRLRKIYQPFSRTEKVRYVPCPLCKQRMHRKIWGSHSGVMVDKCARHGTWFDIGELEKVREFVALGGVEFEKLRLTEKGLGALDRKLEREITRLDVRIDRAYRWARLWSLIGL